MAASRVVLGLHYPSDVAAGALIGAALATATLAIAPV
jgi:undecaprenyl-diphosphatase